jgi:hypothetical protein
MASTATPTPIKTSVLPFLHSHPSGSELFCPICSAMETIKECDKMHCDSCPDFERCADFE